MVLVLFHELHLVAGFFSLVGLSFSLPGTRYGTVALGKRQEFRSRLLADTVPGTAVVVTQSVSVQYGTLKAKGWGQQHSSQHRPLTCRQHSCARFCADQPPDIYRGTKREARRRRGGVAGGGRSGEGFVLFLGGKGWVGARRIH